MSFSDETTGVDLSRVEVLLDGLALAPGCTIGAASVLCEPPILEEGTHTILASAADRAGNRAQTSLSFELILDLESPTITWTSPEDGLYTKEATVVVRGVVADDGQVARVEVNGVETLLAGGAFESTVALEEGANALLIAATDATGKVTFASRMVTLDQEPPEVTVETPKAGQLTNDGDVRVSGGARDDYGIASLTVQGLQTDLVQGGFERILPMTSGANTIEIRATDRAGNQTASVLSLTRFDLPEVTITSPADLSILATTTVDVQGDLGESGAAVSVNGIPAAVSGTSFSASAIPLVEGGNLITATVRDGQGHVATSTVQVVRDLGHRTSRSIRRVRAKRCTSRTSPSRDWSTIWWPERSMRTKLLCLSTDGRRGCRTGRSWPRRCRSFRATTS